MFGGQLEDTASRLSSWKKFVLFFCMEKRKQFNSYLLFLFHFVLYVFLFGFFSSHVCTCSVLCVCVCVWFVLHTCGACIWMHSDTYAHVYVQVPEEDSGSCSVTFHLMSLEPLRQGFSLNLKLCWSKSPSDPPVFTPHAGEATDVCDHVWLFMWVLWIWTQVLMLA